MRSTEALLKSDGLLPVGAISLARFITDPSHPLRSYHDPTFPPKQLFSLALSTEDVSELVQRASGTRYAARLTELLSLALHKTESVKGRLRTRLSTRYELSQWEDAFREAVAQPATRAWLEDMLEDGQDVYFVVGYRTVVDAAIEVMADEKRERSGELRLPVSTVVAANVMPGISLAEALDPGVGVGIGEGERVVKSFLAKGEAVYGIQYCKVSFRWFSSRNVGNSFLGKTCWKVGWSVRGGEAAEEDDVLEAVMEEVDGEDEEAGE